MKRKKNDVIVRRKYKVVGITNLHNLPEKENKKMANSHSRVTKVRFTIITYRKGLTKQKKISLSTYEKKKKNSWWKKSPSTKTAKFSAEEIQLTTIYNFLIIECSGKISEKLGEKNCLVFLSIKNLLLLRGKCELLQSVRKFSTEDVLL